MAKILILATHWPVASGRYMKRAFQRLGHDVRSMGEPKGNAVWGITVDPRHGWVPDYPAPEALRGFWRPDLVLQMDTEIMYADKVCPGVPHAIFSVDNHVRDIVHGGYPRFDKYFMAHHEGPARPVCEECGHVWLPCAYDPTVFTPSPIPMEQRPYDVAMIGYPYERRVKLAEAMRDAGLNVCAGLGPLYDQFAAVYHHAKISLCVSAAGDVAQRVFETAAMNCAILTDPCHDFDRLGFVDGRHGAIFKRDSDAVDMAKAMLSDLNALDDMATTSTWWAIPNTWDARAQTILDTMEIK